MNVVESKQWQMTKKYFKIILKFAKEWMRLPKFFLTALIFFGFYQLQKLPNAYAIYYVIFFSVIVLQLIAIFINSKKLKQKFKLTGKKWMFENIISINGLGNTSLILFYFFDFPFRTSRDFLVMGDFRKFFSAFLITFVVLLAYITLVVIPKRANQLLQETYAAYKIS
jgi:heme exporter protein D